MGLKTVEFQLPEELLKSLGTDEENATKALEAFLLAYVKEGKITASYVAEVLGCSYHEILELMAQHGIPVVRYTPKEFKKEVAALEKLVP